MEPRSVSFISSLNFLPLPFIFKLFRSLKNDKLTAINKTFVYYLLFMLISLLTTLAVNTKSVQNKFKPEVRHFTDDLNFAQGQAHPLRHRPRSPSRSHTHTYTRASFFFAQTRALK
eukprot:gb/GEZN01026580.1/.p1 GENE.gb/GEZN01026580.1/~~gb/GEZN01026580.1/.p1  ORF type:complete len:116 (+),score=3.45 gb/GEZN01026580.1/:165-512(+)